MDTPCEIFSGYIFPNGYGSAWVKGRRGVYANRLAWENKNGPVPEGLCLDHLCRNRACINVEHLEAVTNKENVLRGIGPTAVNARKTHCKNGHELSGDNLLIRQGKQGKYRNCRICHRVLNLATYHRIKHKTRIAKMAKHPEDR